MAIKNNIWYRKFSAAFLLLNLLAITAIQVFHTHPGAGIASQQKTAIEKRDGLGFYKAGADTKCFICDYQLTKDADANYATFNISTPVTFNDVAFVAYNFTAQDIQTVFETRGPPTV